MTRPCIAVLGGSFDPVHYGHLALAELCSRLFHPDILRIVPAGLPWQKGSLHASPEHRVAMLKLAFAQQLPPIFIDCQEISRNTISYTIDTLKFIRTETGTEASVIFMIGADQLHGLNTWHQWRSLFDYAHICAVARPGFSLELGDVPQEVAEQFMNRSGSFQELRDSPCGKTCLAGELSVDISSTGIRNALKQGDRPAALIPHAVLDYIEQHHLYQN